MKSHDILLRHLLDEIDFLLDQTKSLTFEKFVSNSHSPAEIGWPVYS